MKKIVFHQREIFFMFLFGMQEKYKLYPKIYKNEINNLEYPSFKGEDFILIYKEDGIDNLHFIEEADIFITDIYSMYDTDKPIYNKVNQLLDKGHLECIVVDSEGETLIQMSQFLHSRFKQELNKYDNLNFITTRNFLKPNKNKIVTNQSYLSLLYYFYHLSDNLFLQPILPDFSIKNKKYDFISYLGLKVDYKSKSEWRSSILLNIDFNDKRLYTPTSYLSTKRVQQMLEKVVEYPRGNFGSYNWFSLIEAEQAKIKLVFETESPDSTEDDVYSFITEKTLKCFLHNQPYFIFHKKIHREYLKDLGFQFIGGDTYIETIDYITELCKGNIDNWISENQDIFSHNKKLMYKIIYDSNNPHIQLLEHIIKK